MIINIKWPHRHAYNVLINSINEYGADFVCSKCLDIHYRSWDTPLQIAQAKIILTIQESKNILKDNHGK